MVWLASSILLAVSTLGHIMHEQSTFNLKEMEKLKKVLEEKEVALAK